MIHKKAPIEELFYLPILRFVDLPIEIGKGQTFKNQKSKIYIAMII
jgi:hypothetical protein